ncbi:MAG: efflux RND transporter periplasmic adaptor subunit, partial [Pirellulales bacterium]|nr:efflux RND transporter periplasmic adaptor subunit [Pirellulales bacterium]
ILAIVIVSVTAALGAIHSHDSPQADRAAARVLPVQVEVLQPAGQLTIARSYTGTLVARRQSQLGFQRSAKLMHVWVDQGQHVRQGQPLAQLDTRQLEIRKRNLQSKHQEASAVLAELEAGPRVQTIEAARAQVQDLTAQVELQQRTFQRRTQLLDRNATSKESHDEAELGLKSAQAQLEAARQELDELEAGTRIERVEAQAAVVAQLKAQIEDVQVDIDDSLLEAPFEGRILMRHVDEGTVVNTAQPVLEIVESGQLEAHIGIPASVFDDMDNQASVTIIVAQTPWSAKFDRALPEVDLQTRTRIAIFRLDPPAGERLVPGQIARVRIEQTEPTDGYWLPTRSLIRSVRGLWATYVVEADPDSSVLRVHRRDVEVLHAEGDRSLVRGTVQTGDQVITSGTHRVVPDQIVKVGP